jgi:hypothetical protein
MITKERTMVKGIPSRFASGATGLVASTMMMASALPATAAVPTPDPVAAASCGFYHGLTGAYYKHCTSEPYSVKITIKYTAPGRADSEMCVAPNADEWLGWNNDVWNAFYNGKLC